MTAPILTEAQQLVIAAEHLNGNVPLLESPGPGVSAYAPAPILKRCRGGCGRVVSENKNLCLACRDKFAALTLAQIEEERSHGETERG